jgi:hypothetical protein
MNIHHITLVTALFLSSVAAYYSVIGLAAIFAAAFIPVVIMGATLEVAKVVATSWLFRNWGTAPKLIKTYLIAAIAVLMLLTSMGIFGFLSKAHIDQTLAAGTSGSELTVIEQQIQYEQKRIENANKSIATLDRLVDQSNPEASNGLRTSQGRERKQLASEISSANSTIKDLNKQALPLRKDYLQSTADVGPIKFIAEGLYGKETEGVLERAVRWVIVLIVVVFDPLALALLIAANHGLQKHNIPVKRKGRPPRQTRQDNWVKKAAKLIEKKKKGIIEIDKESIHVMK